MYFVYLLRILLWGLLPLSALAVCVQEIKNGDHLPPPMLKTYAKATGIIDTQYVEAPPPPPPHPLPMKKKKKKTKSTRFVLQELSRYADGTLEEALRDRRSVCRKFVRALGPPFTTSRNTYQYLVQ